MTEKILEILKIMEDFGVKLTFSQTVRFASAMRKIFRCPQCKEENGQL